MSEQILKQDNLLNDALERSIMETTMDNGEAISIVTLSKRAIAFVKRTLGKTFDFIVEVGEEVHKARELSEKYTRSYW